MTTVELLTRAADAAGDAALGFELYSNIRPPWNLRETEAHTVGLYPPQQQLIAASGPDHWRAVEGLFRAALVRHGNYNGDCVECSTDQDAEPHPCPALNEFRPLAEQVLQHLGPNPPERRT